MCALHQITFALFLTLCAGKGWAAPEGFYPDGEKIWVSVKGINEPMLGTVKRDPKLVVEIILSGKPFQIPLSPQTLVKVEKIAKSFGGEGDRFALKRTTGGFSNARFQGAILNLSVSRTLSVTADEKNPTAKFTFRDYEREQRPRDRSILNPHANPILGEGMKYDFTEYAKYLPIDSFEGDRAIINDSIIPGKFEFSPDPDVTKQRFVLDVGNQKVIPIYVVETNGANVTFITFDDLQKVEKAQRGEKVDITRYEVPADIVRLATEEQHRTARSQYVDDFRPGAKEAMIRANKEPLKFFQNEGAVINKEDDMAESILGYRKDEAERKAKLCQNDGYGKLHNP